MDEENRVSNFTATFNPTMQNEEETNEDVDEDGI